MVRAEGNASSAPNGSLGEQGLRRPGQRPCERCPLRRSHGILSLVADHFQEVFMTVEMVAPAWMHQQITAEQYAAWTAEQCAGIEIVDGMVVVSPSASKRHNRLARLLANALDAAAGPDWNADTDFDV